MLCWFVVVRCYNEFCICVCFFGELYEMYGFDGIVGSGICDYRNMIGYYFDDFFDYGFMFFVG